MKNNTSRDEKLDQMRVYIAGGFFTEKQLKRVIEVEEILTDEKIEYHSPRSVGVLKSMTRKERLNSMKGIYDSNIDEMNRSTHMIALLSDRDTGTIFEFGYMYGCGKPVVMLSDDISFVSVMLAMGATSICTNKKKLLDALLGEYTEKVGDTT